jgi:uncharacterized protein YegL
MEKQNLKNPNETHYVLVVDKSGSMSHLTKSTITGINEQVQTIKNLQDKHPTQSYFMTYINFNENVNVEFELKKASELQEINESNYVANGGTALNDAIGKGIALMQSNTDLMEKIKTGEGSIVFVIITDGEENASKEYKIDAIRENIKLLETSDRWSFVFIGANIDEVKTASNYGMNIANTMSFSADANSNSRVYDKMSKTMYSRGVTLADSDLIGTYSSTIIDDDKDLKTK